MSTRTLVTVFAIPLLLLAACSREKSDWRSAQAADSPESYEQFISAHPESPLVTTARERMVQLAEEKDWRGAAESDTLEGYRQFLAQYPAGRWAREAQVRIDNFTSHPPTAPAASAPRPEPPDAAAAPEPAAGESVTVPEGAPAETMPPSSGAYGVQLGAFSSAERANAEWTKLQADARGMLDGLSPRVVVGEAAGKAIYRLQAEVRDEPHARAVCGGLKAANRGCVVVPPPGH
jgi:cell division septation protein DedD